MRYITAKQIILRPKFSSRWDNTITDKYICLEGFYVKLHRTYIVRFFPNKIVLNAWNNDDQKSWRTTVTKRRINQVLEAIGSPFKIYQDKGRWFLRDYETGETVEFLNGMEIDYEGNILRAKV